MLCLAAPVYAATSSDDISISGGGKITLTPYSNLANEGQISCDEIIITNKGDVPQEISYRLNAYNSPQIMLKDVSVLSNDFKKNKVAFVNLLNTETKEKYLVYKYSNAVIDTIKPGESISLKLCGELNVDADWQKGDFLNFTLMFSSKALPVETVSLEDEEYPVTEVPEDALEENDAEDKATEVGDILDRPILGVNSSSEESASDEDISNEDSSSDDTLDEDTSSNGNSDEDTSSDDNSDEDSSDTDIMDKDTSNEDVENGDASDEDSLDKDSSEEDNEDNASDDVDSDDSDSDDNDSDSSDESSSDSGSDDSVSDDSSDSFDISFDFGSDSSSDSDTDSSSDSSED